MMLKGRLSVIVFLLVSSCSFSQDIKESQVPDVVKKSFQEKFPNMFVYEWEWKRKERLYQAEFKYRGKEKEVYFDSKGKWIRTETEVEKEELPAPVKEEFNKSEYSDWELDDISECEMNGNIVYYKLDVKKHKNNKFDLYFDKDGNLIKKEKD